MLCGWFPETAFAPGSVWFPLSAALTSVAVVCIADNLHSWDLWTAFWWDGLQLTYSKNRKFSVCVFGYREKRSYALMLYFILFFSGSIIIFTSLLLFPLHFLSPKDAALFLVPSSFRNIASQSCHREPHTPVVSPLCGHGWLILTSFQYFHTHSGLSLSVRTSDQWLHRILLCSFSKFPPSPQPSAKPETRFCHKVVVIFVLTGHLKFVVFCEFKLCHSPGFICCIKWEILKRGGSRENLVLQNRRTNISKKNGVLSVAGAAGRLSGMKTENQPVV